MFFPLVSIVTTAVVPLLPSFFQVYSVFASVVQAPGRIGAVEGI